MAKVQSRQVIKEYQEAGGSISFKNEQGTEDYMGLKADVDELLRGAVFSAYGGIYIANPPIAFPDIGAAWQTVSVFDAESPSSRGVAADSASDSLSVDLPGVYRADIQGSINHNILNAGRTIRFRLYNIDSGTPISNEYPVGIGRNVEDTNISASVFFEAVVAGGRIAVQVGGGDTLTGVNFNSALFAITGISAFID
jgi:hypothetical protein